MTNLGILKVSPWKIKNLKNNMNKITPFQIILMAGFGVVAIVSVLIFSGVLPGYKNQGTQKGPAVSVSLWGDFAEKPNQWRYFRHQQRK